MQEHDEQAGVAHETSDFENERFFKSESYFEDGRAFRFNRQAV